MMMLHLIKKDILIAKSFVFVAILIVIAVPLYFMFAVPFLPSVLPFLYMVVFVEIVLLQNISAVEAKSPKALALLCAAPYTRKALVKAKYLFFVLLFLFCYAVHTLLALIFDRFTLLDLSSVLTVLLFGVIIYGIYTPVEFKFGNVKARFIFGIVIVLASAGPVVFSQFLSGIDLSGLMESIVAIPIIIKCVILASLSTVFFVVSMAISMQIFSKKEL